MGAQSPPGGRREKTGLGQAACELRAGAPGGALPARLHLQGGHAAGPGPHLHLALDGAAARVGPGARQDRVEGWSYLSPDAGLSGRRTELPLGGAALRGGAIFGGGAFSERGGPISGVGLPGPGPWVKLDLYLGRSRSLGRDWPYSEVELILRMGGAFLGGAGLGT